MKYKTTTRLLTFAASLLLASSVIAKSPVFKVSKGDDYLFIGGTIHLLSPNDYPLPEAFDQAFNAAEHVYFETNIGEISLPEVQAKLAQVMTLPQGKTLQTELNDETYTKLEAFLNERQIPIIAFNQSTAGAVSITLTLLELQRLGLGDPNSGVDQFFESKTNEVNKSAFYLESLEEQIGFLGSFNSVDSNVVINSSLEDLSDLTKNWKEALNAWRAGDMELMSESIGGNDLKSEFPQIYKILLTDRNNRWVTEIKSMLKSKEIELVLVGALHLVNDDGLIEQLKSAGYKIEQLD